MSIRTKLIGAFLLVALLVPVLGGVAVSRVQSINGDVETLSKDAVPRLMLVKELDEIQREQHLDVLNFQASGRPEDRQRYLDMSKQFDAKLADLSETQVGADQVTAAQSKQQAKQVSDERTMFDAAAGQLLGARATIDRNTGELRAKNNEIVQELGSIRRRYLGGSDPGNIPQTVRYQVNDLLLGAEGMLRTVDNEFALVNGYNTAPDPAAKEQFEGAGGTFNNWLALANNAAGPDDKRIIERVQGKFFKEFEPAARSMMLASENAARARGIFTEASNGISAALDEIVKAETDTMATARSDAEATAGSTGNLMLTLTIIAFAAAGALGVWFAGSITRPLLQLRDAAERVSRGDIENVAIDVNTKDEVGDLAGAFRRMVASVRFLMQAGEDDGAGVESDFARAS